MTINEALSRVDTLVPNTYDREIKYKWLSSVEGILINKIFSKFIGIPAAARQYTQYDDPETFPEEEFPNSKISGNAITFTGFDNKTAGDTELLAPQEYDEIYVQWMLTKIHYYNDETIKYNNAALAFDAMQTELRNHWAQTHTPIQTAARYF